MAVKKKVKFLATICESCGANTANYGVMRCNECGETKCVEFCIPGGANTKCLACEESEDVD